MSPSLFFLIPFAVGALFVIGWPRIRIPRSPGVESIDDPSAAQAYDRISRLPQFRQLRRMIVARLSERAPSGVLADLGCGPGLLTSRLATTYPALKVIGIDASREMIQAAASNASALGLSSHLEFREGDIARLPLPDGCLDFAVTTMSLHHWSSPAQALEEVYRVLRPGGRLLLFDLRRDARRFFFLLMVFAQTFVVPAPLRRAGEPLGSLKASYTRAELEILFARSPFRGAEIDDSAAWHFAWAQKPGNSPA